jgi:site-specific DNA-methyltransferase (adenine-specific)
MRRANALSLFPSERDTPPSTSRAKALGQYMTPLYVADLLLSRDFSDLKASDLVLDPSAGRGAWLHAVPADVPAFGIEIDAELAAESQRDTGRTVIAGDFLRVTIPDDAQVTAIVGNPPFANRMIVRFLERAHALLAPSGRVGFIIPAALFSSANVAMSLASQWSIRYETLPRFIYPRLTMPLAWAVLRKDAQPTLVGFAIYAEIAAIADIRREYRRLLEHGSRPPWRAVVTKALEICGGTASLKLLTRLIAHARPTDNRFWHDKIRQVCVEHMERVSIGVYRLPSSASLAA